MSLSSHGLDIRAQRFTGTPFDRVLDFALLLYMDAEDFRGVLGFVHRDGETRQIASNFEQKKGESDVRLHQAA
ncbi:hypothetical protein [Arcanobacterium pinnipediorum]|uniref:Uncharacterized protein n=1 Tax=Arcanobacterium pinnipediorum TaxID=1503041 RepID=A0ABY5AGJ7_9ACTO|nr:hypothetical protein [Arcanobacterium pinnipediorum]USR79048.1 hypothetical protein NG665_06565 [Arcanobacterium pinnipediorum]